jgi:hypothetical protein
MLDPDYAFYMQQADHCHREAQTAPADRDREHYLQARETWLALARTFQRSG